MLVDTIVKFVNNDFYKEDEAISVLLEYVSNPYKTDGYVGAFNASGDRTICAEQMKTVHRYFGGIKDRQMIHLIISDPVFNRIDMLSVWSIAGCIAQACFPTHQVYWGIHKKESDSNTGENQCCHIHLIINAVSFITGNKFHLELNELEQFKEKIQAIIH